MKIYIAMDMEAPELSQRAIRRASVAGMSAVGAVYEDEVKPRKTEPGAAQRYGYQQRQPKYLERKRGGYVRDRMTGARYPIPEGGTRDLVYTGRTRAALRQANLVRAYPTRATVRLAALPTYIRIRPWKSGHPPMGEEITRVTPDEIRRMETRYQEEAQRQLDQSRRRTTRRTT